MQNYIKWLILGWSIACIGIFIISYQVLFPNSQIIEVKLEITKSSEKGPWDNVIDLGTLAPGSKFIFEKLAQHNPNKIIYTEKNYTKPSFYFAMPGFCFIIWAIPITVLSILGIFLFKHKKN